MTLSLKPARGREPFHRLAAGGEQSSERETQAAMLRAQGIV